MVRSVLILLKELVEVSLGGVGGVGGGLPPSGGDRFPFDVRVTPRSRLMPRLPLVLPASPDSSTTGRVVPVRSSLWAEGLLAVDRIRESSLSSSEDPDFWT